MSTHAEASLEGEAQPVGQEHRTGLIARIRGLPVVSWFVGERRAAACGTGAGFVGGTCCVGGAVVLGLGLSSTASVSAFVDASTPYFIGVSVAMMLAWLAWIVRRTGFKPKSLAQNLIRHGLVMGVIYGVTLAAAMGLGALI